MNDDARRSMIENARGMLVARGNTDESVEIEDREIVVTSPDARRRAPLGDLADAWNVLPPGDRQRRLAAILAMVPSPASAGKGGGGVRVVVGWAVAATLALLALASVAWARGEVAAAGERQRQRQAAAAAPPLDTAARDAQRHQTVCTGVRKRVVGGAAFGPYETEGWLVEIWLGREDGTLTPAHPRLAELAAARAVPKDMDEALAAIKGEVVVAELPVPPGAAETARPGGAVVQLHGSYAESYLDPVERARFVTLADRLYEATGAELGALWGRCGQLPWHDLGAWYRGTDRGAAAGAMIFMAGRYSDSGAVAASARDGSANTLGAFLARARTGVDDRVVSIAILDVGGKIDAMHGAGSTITFPVGGYTLATRSSRELVALLDR